MADFHEMQRREFERQRIEKARRLADLIDMPMNGAEIARRMSVVRQTALTLLDEAIRQGFVTVIGERATGKLCLFVRADAPSQADDARAALDRDGRIMERILAACPAKGYARARDIMEAAGLHRGTFTVAARELSRRGCLEAVARREPVLLGLVPGQGLVTHPDIVRVESVDLFDHINPMRLRIVQIVEDFGGVASARQVRGVMAEHGLELSGTLDIATALAQEAKSGWVRVLREEGVWRVRFELTDMGTRVAAEANRTRPLADPDPGPSFAR